MTLELGLRKGQDGIPGMGNRRCKVRTARVRINHSGDGKWCRNGQNWEVRRRRLENKQSAEFRALGVLGRLEGF